MATDENITNELDKEKGRFVGFALLSKKRWSKEKFFKDMKEEWNINLTDSEENSERNADDTIVYAEYNGMRIITGLVPAPVPGREAEHFAMANYMWKDAVAQTEKHKAHLVITVMGEGSTKDKAALYVKAACAAIKQHSVIGLYSNGAVYEPKMFRSCAEVMKDNTFPILNTIWFGLYSDGTQAGVYTYGMRQFGKEEIEVYMPRGSADLNALRNFTVSVAAYILDGDVTLNDGETIGFSEDERLPVVISPALAFSGNSVKIDLQKK